MQQTKQTNYEFFLKTDMSDLIGQWVAISNGKIVAHGESPKKVMAEAKEKNPKDRILLVRVPDKETMIF